MRSSRSNNVAFSLFSFQDIITSVTGIMILVTLILALELIDRVEQSSESATQATMEESQSAIESLVSEIETIESSISAATETLNDAPSLDVDDLKSRIQALANESAAIRRQIKSHLSQITAKRKAIARRERDSIDQNQEFEVAATALDDAIKKADSQIADLEKKLKNAKDRDRVYFKTASGAKTTWLVEIKSTGYRIARTGVSEPPKSFSSLSTLRQWAATLDVNANAFLLILKPGGKSRFRRCRQLLLDKQKGGFGFDVGVHVMAADQEFLDPETGAGV